MKNQTKVTIIDRPCGYGKTRAMLRNLKPERQYLLIAPDLEQLSEYIKHSVVPLTEPQTWPETEHRRKRDHLQELLEEGHSVVTTHAMYTDIAYLAQAGLLMRYDVICDEVLEVAEVATGEVTKTAGQRSSGVTMQSWKKLYLGNGYAVIDPETSLVIPTEKWEQSQDVRELSTNLYNMASVQTLYAVGDNILVNELPPVLLKAVGSLTIYTFMAEGSLMAAFLRRCGINYTHDVDQTANEKFREDAKRLITIEAMPKLRSILFSHTAQGRLTKTQASVVAKVLKQLREGKLKGADLTKVLVTSAKSKWFNDREGTKPGPFSSGSRMFDATNWVGNTTRGTNQYRDCTHLIYLWCQHLNPTIAQFLNVGDAAHRDMYSLSELLQWVYRSQIRDGKPITLYLPSNRMRSILQRWLDGDLELY